MAFVNYISSVIFIVITVDHDCATSRSTPDSSTRAFAVPHHKVDRHMQAGHTFTSECRGTEMFTEYKHWTVLERYVLTTDNSHVKADSQIPCRSLAVSLPIRSAKGLDCVFPI
jgi:hypothetical protein